MQDGLISRAGATIYNDAFSGKGPTNYDPVNGTGQYSPTKSSCAHLSRPSPPSPQHTPNGDFKLCGYEGTMNSCGPLGDECVPNTAGTGAGKADIFGVLEFWLRLRYDLTTVPWEQLKTVQLKNPRAAPGCAYIPTKVEHIANIITHGTWVLPSMYAGLQLYDRSHTPAQTLAAVIYGAALSMLFFVSTCFHCVCYCNHNRPLKDALHRCDRAMIYIFIAGSYYPWLSLGHTTHPQIVSVVKWSVWVMAVLGIVYQQMYHERYKCLETFFYVVIGLGPSVVIILWGHEFTGMSELKFGGILYIIGIVFFKSDGLFPFAHAIWHLFVVFAASVHYFAIMTHLFPDSSAIVTPVVGSVAG
ncbi:monocyte to macrophage differentiation factor [Anopheles funestus]|uniref:monocyte to macrophage differentiation factor n=1 Tax=Anopheles funestus TaxID=62324 RepID=UPI0020C67ED4|nr:monocyte to macrophage differentiation factor [Anopheles funestus]XP_049296569.1 monocyte to macrophage differentiation factor [Anopheles funestus]XP_049296570.1 monocyte to macrophage differentiation factor [Anopheles funestus]XP_049296571.1 monocyte to macrophage differentiation factor [Anopheles funestus]